MKGVIKMKTEDMTLSAGFPVNPSEVIKTASNDEIRVVIAGEGSGGKSWAAINAIAEYIAERSPKLSPYPMLMSDYPTQGSTYKYRLPEGEPLSCCDCGASRTTLKKVTDGKYRCMKCTNKKRNK